MKKKKKVNYPQGFLHNRKMWRVGQKDHSKMLYMVKLPLKSKGNKQTPSNIKECREYLMNHFRKVKMKQRQQNLCISNIQLRG